MASINLDSIDRKLLNLVQREFPLTEEPYTDLGRRLGIDGDEVIHHIEQLKARGIIRQISPVLDARSLGYQTTLVAMKVADQNLDKAARVIGADERVSHGYQRDHSFNFWFTLGIPDGADIESELEKLTSPIGVEAVFSLPAIKVFKLRVYFDMEDNSHSASSSQPDGSPARHFELSASDRLVINELQQDLPLDMTPFTVMASRLNMDVELFLIQCQSLLQRGIIRRFSASLNHQQAGFKANAMTCWAIPPENVDTIGRKLALLPEVSHCYERKTNPLWQYNIFAMIHSHSKDACREIASQVARETGLTDYVVLFSTREFKRTRVKYLV